MNKAETVIRVEKLEQDKAVSKISCDMVRGIEFEPIYFRIVDNLPEIIVNYTGDKTGFE